MLVTQATENGSNFGFLGFVVLRFRENLEERRDDGIEK